MPQQIVMSSDITADCDQTLQKVMLLQGLLMVPGAQVNAWEDRFAVKLAFRKLSLVMTSLRCNVWYQHLKANNWLPSD